MADEATRKAVALEYCRLMNAGDLDGALALFAPDIRFEDPVGTPALVGLGPLRAHLAKAIDARIEEEPESPTVSMDNESVALPVSGTMDVPGTADGGRVAFHLISLMRVNPAGLIFEVRIIAGQTDYRLAGSSATSV